MIDYVNLLTEVHIKIFLLNSTYIEVQQILFIQCIRLQNESDSSNQRCQSSKSRDSPSIVIHKRLKERE